MCMPGNHGLDTEIQPYLYFTNTTPVQPEPALPPHRRRRVHRHQRQAPPPPPPQPPTSRRKRKKNAAKTCKCHNTPEEMRLCAKRRQMDTEDITLSIRLFIVVIVAILTSTMISDLVFPEGVKAQLPPIEQGNMVIDSIFQIPINTLSAVGTLIKTARPLVRRTRERIQQYYNNGYQPQQYGQQQNGQQQYGQQPYSYALQQYYNRLQQQNGNGQQYYTSGKKRYSVGRMHSDADSRSRLTQDDGGQEFARRAKRTQVNFGGTSGFERNFQPPGRNSLEMSDRPEGRDGLETGDRPEGRMRRKVECSTY